MRAVVGVPSGTPGVLPGSVFEQEARARTLIAIHPNANFLLMRLVV